MNTSYASMAVDPAPPERPARHAWAAVSGALAALAPKCPACAAALLGVGGVGAIAPLHLHLAVAAALAVPLGLLARRALRTGRLGPVAVGLAGAALVVVGRVAALRWPAVAGALVVGVAFALSARAPAGVKSCCAGGRA